MKKKTYYVYGNSYDGKHVSLEYPESDYLGEYADCRWADDGMPREDALDTAVAACIIFAEEFLPKEFENLK